MKPTTVSFSPALLCMECKQPTTQGPIYPMSPLAWQLLPLCDKGIGKPGRADEEEPFASRGDLQQRITSRIETREHLQRQRRQVTRAYLRLRRQHAHIKAQRSFRWRLRCISQLEAMEVQG